MTTGIPEGALTLEELAEIIENYDSTFATWPSDANPDDMTGWETFASRIATMITMADPETGGWSYEDAYEMIEALWSSHATLIRENDPLQALQPSSPLDPVVVDSIANLVTDLQHSPGVKEWWKEAEPETGEPETGEPDGGEPDGTGGEPDGDDTYIPGEGQMPLGWLSMWGEDNATVGDWLDMWVKRYNDNNKRDIPYSDNIMDRDYLWDPTDGLYAQEWWSGMTTDFSKMVEMWYVHGGPGAVLTGTPPPGLVDVDGGNWNPTFDLRGDGDWRYIWDGSIDVIRATIEDLGIDPNILGNNFINEMALDLMARGGATARLSPQSRPNWDDEAVQLIESRVISQWFDDDGNFMPGGTYGAGTVKDVEDELRAFARSQMLYDVDDDEFREWALAIKSERGLSQSQVEAEIADRAYGFWGLDSTTKQQMIDSGLTIGNKISPLYAAATDVWGDTTVTPNDSWLMDNYQVTGDDGVTRFRSGPEMRRAARGNLERFQYSDDYQDPLNRFITGATAMFRSDY